MTAVASRSWNAVRLTREVGRSFLRHAFRLTLTMRLQWRENWLTLLNVHRISETEGIASVNTCDRCGKEIRTAYGHLPGVRVVVIKGKAWVLCAECVRSATNGK